MDQKEIESLKNEIVELKHNMNKVCSILGDLTTALKPVIDDFYNRHQQIYDEVMFG
jgi:hypothetical protein